MKNIGNTNINCFAYDDKKLAELLSEYAEELDEMATEISGITAYKLGEASEREGDERAWLEEEADDLDCIECAIEDVIWQIKKYLEG